MPDADCLKLAALDEEDLAILSAHVQDAAVANGNAQTRRLGPGDGTGNQGVARCISGALVGRRIGTREDQIVLCNGLALVVQQVAGHGHAEQQQAGQQPAAGAQRRG